MAYTPATLSLFVSQMGGPAPQLWLYTTAADADATIVGAGYFSDGYTKGMKLNDIVHVVATTGPKYKLYQVTTAGTFASPAVTVSAPTAIT